jgi:signal transduction histidine kinase
MTARSLFDSATLRLTAWYMLILMFISLLFSMVLYRVASDEFDRAFGPRGGINRVLIDNDTVVDARQQMVEDSNKRLLGNLALFNVVVLLGGGVMSYWLARRTLRPIELALDGQMRFSSDAAHELRTPLAVMQSEIEVGLREKKSTRQSHQRLLESNLDEVQRMQTLTERLLLLAHNQDMELGPTDVETAAVEAMNRTIMLAKSKYIAIENTVAPVQATANAEALTDALAILLDNAVKYSPNKTTITLGSVVEGGHVTVSVRDQGAGIKPTDIPHIFDRFYRADESRSKVNVEGYGLGLSIVKRLMDVQRGQVSVSSQPGEGSTFTLRLPKA